MRRRLTYTEAKRLDQKQKKRKNTLFKWRLHTTLCVPDPTQSLGDTHVVCLKLVQTDSGGQGKGAQEPVAEGVELGHTLRTEVIDDSGPGRVLEV